MTTEEYDYDPCDIEAEQWVIAAMMHSPEAIAAAAEVLEERHFYRASHKVMFNALVMMLASGAPVDPVVLRAWIQSDGDTRAFGDQGLVYIADLYGLPVVGDHGSTTYHARLVLAAALRRHGIQQSTRIRQILAQPGDDPDEIMARYDRALDAIRMAAQGRSAAASGFADVTEHVRKDHQMVVPGLLGEQDRAVVVAGEGRGKTTLAHQIAFCAAAGVHPFMWGERIPPRRVLIADFENPALELGDRFSALGAAASNYAGWHEDNVKFFLRMGGVNLTRAGDAFELMEVIARFRPHLIVAGPIYKMLTGLKPNEDGLRAHAAVAGFFDKVRERHGSAVWLESHAPFGANGRERELRPEGWNGWMKWPEFGFALRKAAKNHGGDNGVEFGRFRGDRIAGRQWPAWMTRNPAYPASGWPWQAGWEKNTLATSIFEGED